MSTFVDTGMDFAYLPELLKFGDSFYTSMAPCTYRRVGCTFPRCARCRPHGFTSVGTYGTYSPHGIDKRTFKTWDDTATDRRECPHPYFGLPHDTKRLSL